MSFPYPSALVLLLALGAVTSLSACVPPSGGGGGVGHGSKGAPGPIAGAGLTVLIAAGAYAAFRHRRSDRD